ncbi:hypothetical protein DF186_25020, partial [Enterococcus hirae]
MAASAALAITLIPVLMGYFVSGKIKPEDKNPINRSLIKIYKPALTGILKYPKATLTAMGVLLLVGLWPATKIGSEFM